MLNLFSLWAREDSNLQPISYEPSALPLSYRPPPYLYIGLTIISEPPHHAQSSCAAAGTHIPQMQAPDLVQLFRALQPPTRINLP